MDNLEPFTFETDRLNVAPEVIHAQVRTNLEYARLAELPDVWPHSYSFQEIALIGGGPSTLIELDVIRHLAAQGVKLVAMNGSYNFLLDHDLRPSAMVMVDARQSNTRFLDRYVEGCKYFLASQCHPTAFTACAERETYIWHGINDATEYDITREMTDRFMGVFGGSTVFERAIGVFSILGYRWMHAFGFDCCYLEHDGKLIGHAYEQSENDGEPVEPYTNNGRTFMASAWHIIQFRHFLKMVQEHGDRFNLCVHGDGMVAHFMASLPEGPGDGGRIMGALQ